MSKTDSLRTFMFNFPDQKLYEDYPLLDSIGWERRTGKLPYFNEGKDQISSKCIFQYTVSGEGMLKIDRNTYKITTGQAILLVKPGTFTYWLSENSSHWEFKYITLSLASVHYWNKIIDVYGHVINVSNSAEVLAYWSKLYDLTLKNKINSIYKCSAYAYTFIMNLQESLKKEYERKESLSAVQKCIDVIHSNYHLPMDLEQLSAISGISQFYLSKLFKETVGVSPIQYLIKHRLKMAHSLLLRTSFDIGTIAKKCGFENTNYFSRLFKKYSKLTPTEYRETEAKKPQIKGGKPILNYIEIDLSIENEEKYHKKS